MTPSQVVYERPTCPPPEGPHVWQVEDSPLTSVTQRTYRRTWPTKRYDITETYFDTRYERWLAALESGDEAELIEATATIPTLDSRVLDEHFAVESDDPGRPGERAVEQRLIVLLRELQDVKPTGRPRIYCSQACRKVAYEDRRAHRDGAVQVQVVERRVTEVMEQEIEVPRPRIDCIKSILADDDAMIRVIRTLAVLVQDRTRMKYDPSQPKFERLRQHTKSLCDSLEHRMGNDQS